MRRRTLRAMGSTTSDERLAWLALALVPGVGFARLLALRERIGSLRGALEAPFELLCTVPGITAECAAAVAALRWNTVERVLSETGSCGGRILIPGDPEYPAVLEHIPFPPALLFALGDLSLTRCEAVAIVGARHHTTYGASVCARVAAACAAGGLVVVSGMARGLDAVAHDAALGAGGRSVGVLGNGFGVVYPHSNLRLYEAMAARGLLLTEFAPGERPTRGSFQRRNRLISGLARVTVVIEAGARSGTLITAGTALEQNRDVMAVPGPVTSAASVGANRLIRDGALPLLEMEDLWARYPGFPLTPADPDGLARQDSAQSRVLHVLREGPMHVDALARRMNAGPAELLSLLAAMEMQDLVRQEPGMVFRRPVATFAAESDAP
jgi:DNA processing protein